MYTSSICCTGFVHLTATALQLQQVSITSTPSCFAWRSIFQHCKVIRCRSKPCFGLPSRPLLWWECEAILNCMFGVMNKSSLLSCFSFSLVKYFNKNLTLFPFSQIAIKKFSCNCQNHEEFLEQKLTALPILQV